MGGAGPSAGSTGSDFAPDLAGRAPAAPFLGAPRALAEPLAAGAARAAGMKGGASRASTAGMSSQGQGQGQGMSDRKMNDEEGGSLPLREPRSSCRDRRQREAARAAGGLGRGAEAPGLKSGVKYGSMRWS